MSESPEEMNDEVVESGESSDESNSFQIIQKLKKNIDDPNSTGALMDLVSSPDIFPDQEGPFADTINECVDYFEKKSVVSLFRGSKVARKLQRKYKQEAFESKFLKKKFGISIRTIINGFIFYKLSQNHAIISKIQEIYHNPSDWVQRYLTLNYFLALKIRVNEKVQAMSGKARDLMDKYESAGKHKELNQVREKMKHSLADSRVKVLTNNYLLFLEAALPMAYGHINDNFDYQAMFTYREFIRSLRAKVDQVADYGDRAVQKESEAIQFKLESRREALIREAKGGKDFTKLHRNEMEKINNTLMEEKKAAAARLEEMIKRVNELKIQAYRFKGLEKNIPNPKKPKVSVEQEISLPRETYKEIEKTPHNDIEENVEQYISDICMGVSKASCMTILHPRFDKLLEEIVVKYGQIWPTIYAKIMMDANKLFMQKDLYEAKLKFTTSNNPKAALHGDRTQMSQACTQLLQRFNTVESQLKKSSLFKKVIVSYYLDKALLLKRMIMEIYPHINVSANVKVNHVEKAVSSVKSAEKAVTKVMESDSNYEAKMDEKGRGALIKSLYSISTLLILENEDDDDEDDDDEDDDDDAASAA